MSKSPAAQLLTVKQVAEELSLSRVAVYDLCRVGKLPHYRLGVKHDTIRIKRSDVSAYLEACERREPDADELAEVEQPARRPERVERKRAPRRGKVAPDRQRAAALGLRCLTDQYLPKSLRA